MTTASTIPLLLSLPPTNSSLSPAELSALYASSLAAHNSSYVPNACSRTTLVAEVAYLNSLRDVERASIERCERAGVWREVTPQIIENVAEEAIRDGNVVLRPGARRLIQEVLKEKGRIVVVSVGWSRRFIHKCLRVAFGEESSAVEVKANEIGEDGKLDRYFEAEGSGIWTSGDKARLLKEVVGDAKDVKTIYVGDSVTDLQCLTLVDVGICIRGEGEGSEQRELLGTLDRLGIECRWVLEYKGIKKGSTHNEEAGLWWAKDFQEICESKILFNR